MFSQRTNFSSSLSFGFTPISDVILRVNIPLGSLISVRF